MLKFGPKNCDKIDALLARTVKFDERNGRNLTPLFYFWR